MEPRSFLELCPSPMPAGTPSTVSLQRTHCLRDLQSPKARLKLGLPSAGLCWGAGREPGQGGCERGSPPHEAGHSNPLPCPGLTPACPPLNHTAPTLSTSCLRAEPPGVGPQWGTGEDRLLRQVPEQRNYSFFTTPSARLQGRRHTAPVSRKMSPSELPRPMGTHRRTRGGHGEQSGCGGRDWSRSPWNPGGNSSPPTAGEMDFHN